MGILAKLFKRKKNTNKTNERTGKNNPVNGSTTSMNSMYEVPEKLLYVIVRAEYQNYDQDTISEIIEYFLKGLPEPSSNIFVEKYCGNNWDTESDKWNDAYVENWLNQLADQGKIPRYDLTKCKLYANNMARDYQIDKGLLVVGIRVAP